MRQVDPVPGVGARLVGADRDDEDPSTILGNSEIGGVDLDEDFNGGDGGFTVTDAGNPEGPWTYDAGLGTWFTNGSSSLGAPSHSRLTSPTIDISGAGEAILSFVHRYSVEGDLWDGMAVFVSLNGADFTQVLNDSFLSNGYTGFGLIGNHDLNGGEGYNGDSPGYASRTFITSNIDLGSLSAGDTLEVQFLGAWDEGAKGAEPNWEIDSVSVLSGLGVTGDFNFDGAVDLSDFDILLANMLVGGSYDEGDINFSGSVDLQDFVEFRQAYEAAAAAVPEPSSFALIALAFGGVFATRTLRRRAA